MSEEILDKYEMAVINQKYYKRLKKLKPIDNKLKIQERISKKQVQVISGGYNTGNGFLILLDKNTENDIKEKLIKMIYDL